MKKLLLAAAVAVALAPSVGVTQEAVRVIDGDTLTIGDSTFRLHGIDAPEFGQKCSEAGGGTWACGKEATKRLQLLVRGQSVDCDNRGADGFGRTIAVCHVNEVDLNAEMVSQGFAWAFRKYSTDYAELEDTIRRTGKGIWQAKTQTPWEYRAAKWEVAAQESPAGCPTKGNISKSGRIYHAPWSAWYNRTKLSVEKGERWFCDEADALAAGWRAPIWGN